MKKLQIIMTAIAAVSMALAMPSGAIADNPALADPADANLYRGRTILTGQGENGRQAGFADTFTQVLMKVSGDSRLIGHPRAGELAAHAGDFVVNFGYYDRMSGIPTHDEQGTRDRPYDLTVDFDPTRIDAILADIGASPWPAPRPKLAVIVSVRLGDSGFLMSSDGNSGRDHRDAMVISAWRVGMPYQLPTLVGLSDAGARFTGFDAATAATTDMSKLGFDADYVLSGQLDWSDEIGGWISDWYFATSESPKHWQLRGGSFDRAFLGGFRGAAQILSGNGTPD